MPEVSCPHYPPSSNSAPTFVCRGCGSVIANPRHPANAGIGSNYAMVARPEEAAKPIHRFRTGS